MYHNYCSCPTTSMPVSVNSLYTYLCHVWHLWKLNLAMVFHASTFDEAYSTATAPLTWDQLMMLHHTLQAICFESVSKYTHIMQAAESSSMQRDVASPADISMDSSLLYTQFPSVQFCTFRQALQRMRPTSQWPLSILAANFVLKFSDIFNIGCIHAAIFCQAVQIWHILIIWHLARSYDCF